MISPNALPSRSLVAVYCLLLTTAFCCAKPDNTSPSPTPENQAQGTDSLQQAILVMDGYQIFPDSTAAYYQAVRRKLSNLTDEGYTLYLQGRGKRPSRLLCQGLLGIYRTSTINDSTFQISGSSNWPKTGLWKDQFAAKNYFVLTININDQGWKIDRLHFPDLQLTPSSTNTDSLRISLDKYLNSPTEDLARNASEFSFLEQYEFALFTEVVNGKSHRINEYLNLQENYNLAYIGQFSEYYTANLYYLLAREIITPDMLQERGMYDRHSWLLRVYGYR